MKAQIELKATILKVDERLVTYRADDKVENRVIRKDLGQKLQPKMATLVGKDVILGINTVSEIIYFKEI